MPTDMQTVVTTSDYHVAAGAQLVFTNQPAFALSQPIVAGAWASPSPHLWISGEVDVVTTSAAAAGAAGMTAIGVSNTFDSSPSVTLDPGATLKVTVTGGSGTGFFGGGSATTTFNNAGAVIVSADGAATGIVNWVNGGPITNSGQVTVSSSKSDATGLKTADYGAQVVNSGTITVTGHGQVTGVDMGSGTADVFHNTGTIVAHETGSATPSVGVSWGDGPQPGQEGSFVNDGTIEADRALEVTTVAGTAAENLITNNGHMIGDVLVVGVAPTTILNNGDVTGAIDLRANGSVYDGRLGTAEGPITAHNLDGDTLLGGAGAETINGAGNDVISGGGGNDVIDGGQDAATGGTGVAQINGNAGDDTIVGHSVAGDWLYGGQGDDQIDVSTSSGHNTISGDLGNDSLIGGSGFNAINGNQGDDTVVGHSLVGDWLLGGQGNDSIAASASSGHNLIYGNLGNDTLVGGTGGDTIRGGQGDDVIHAGTGKDWISGDLGSNTIVGGSGNDTFHGSAGHDLISGWHAGDHVQVDQGVTYTVTQSGADVHVDLSNGGQLILRGVTQTSLQSGWIFTA